mgnify:CR=1 FL=1
MGSRRYRIAGVMSGTSLDGVDVALAEFWQEARSERFRLLRWEQREFPPALRSRLRHIQEEPAPIAEIARLQWELTAFVAECLRSCCHALGVEPSALDAVGFHGQTVYHEPLYRCERGYGVGLQLGNPSALAQWLETTVVGDFRSADLALGGEGAPLVPLFDWAFLRSRRDFVVALNLGGIANVTVLPPGCSREQVRAWDTGPGNLWLDAATERLLGLPYDADGARARTGRLLPALWHALLRIPYIEQPPPKSTGRELFSRARLYELLGQTVASGTPAEDVLHTLTRFTAWSVAENLRRYAPGCTHMLVSGGGARNGFLMECLRYELPHLRIEPTDVIGIPVQAKEALCFAYLAYRTVRGKPGNMPSVTGARREAVLGVLAVPGRFRHQG